DLARRRHPRHRAGEAAGGPRRADRGRPSRRAGPRGGADRRDRRARARHGGGRHLMVLAASSIHVTVEEVAAALALVAVAAIASRPWHAGLEEDIGIAVVRSLIQLTAIGYVITLIFDEDSFLLVLALLTVMVVFGAFTARKRAKGVPDSFWPLLGSLAVAAAAT